MEQIEYFSDRKPTESYILLLNDDCLQEIFDWLCLKDLCAVGKTCKRLQRVAGEYFGRIYDTKSVFFFRTHAGDIVQKIDGIDTKFGKYAQQLDFYNNNIDMFRYAGANGNTHLRSIQFDVKEISAAHVKCIRNLLTTVETVTLYRCIENVQLFHQIVVCCVNMKCLTLYNWPITKYEWPKQTYPTLNALELYGKYEAFSGRCEGLITFLKRNKQIKNISTSINLSGVLDIIANAGIDLDKLGFVVDGLDKMTPSIFRQRLNAFHECGHFKHLKMFCCWANDLPNYMGEIHKIHGLTTVEIVYMDHSRCEMDDVITVLTTLEHLKALRLFHFRISTKHANTLSQYLVHLEELHLGRNSLEGIIPFARNISKLSDIEIGEDELASNIDESIRVLDCERANLFGAAHLTIHLPEEAFIRMKNSIFKYKCIKFKRDMHVYPIH